MTAISGVDITKVYSPVRVVAVAAQSGLTPGRPFDLTNGWDFNEDYHRTSAWKSIKEQDPYCINVSPPCTMSSMLQGLTKSVKNHDPAWCKRHKEVGQATRHIDFRCGLYGC